MSSTVGGDQQGDPMTTDAAADRARKLFEQRSWGEAYEALRAADGSSPLTAADLERLAVAAY